MRLWYVDYFVQASERLSLAEYTQAEAYIDTTTDIDFLILPDILTSTQSSFN